MKEIERYIQFAIDNGYDNKSTLYKNFWLKEWFNNIPNWDFSSYYDWLLYPNYYTFIITSKPFIEAVARGLLEKEYWKDSISIAIRDNKLEEFITNLLWEAK